MFKIILSVLLLFNPTESFKFQGFNSHVPNKKIDTCNILSFSGAGSFGAVEAGMLNAILEASPGMEYDMITGVSAGGLNAGFLAYYNDGKNLQEGVKGLKELYGKVTNENVYVRNLFDIYTNWAYYDTHMLRQTLQDELSKLESRTIEHPTLVGATNLNTGNLDIFRYDKSAQSEQLKILMATSAIPFLFPPEKITFGDKTNIYVDGGAISNEIISGAVSFINCNKYNITFITASEKMEVKDDIDSLSDFSKRVVEVIVTNFNNQLAAIISNPCETNVRGNIHYCYPKTNKLDDYSFLDFNNGDILYQLGNDHLVCDRYNYCG